MRREKHHHDNDNDEDDDRPEQRRRRRGEDRPQGRGFVVNGMSMGWVRQKIQDDAKTVS